MQEFVKHHEVYPKYYCNVKTGEYSTERKFEVGLRGVKRYSGFFYTKDEGIPVHELIFTCDRGAVPTGYKVSHRNHNPMDNRIANLVLCEIKDQKAIRKTAHANAKPIKVTNGHATWYFKSKNACAKFFKIGVSCVFRYAEGLRKGLSFNSELGQLSFSYVEPKNVPNGEYIVFADPRLGKKKIKEHAE